MTSHEPWVKSIIGSVAHSFAHHKDKHLPFARTERRLNDVKKRFGKDYIAKMDVVDIGELPAFIVRGHSKLSQRDLNLIGTAMDNHLGVSGFYVQASALRFLVSTPEVGAVPLHQAIMDELNVKLMPIAKLDTEHTLNDLKVKFGANVVKYLQKIDLLELLFDGDEKITKVPSVIRDLSRVIINQCLEDVGCFSKKNTNEYSILFFSPDPEFAKKNIAHIQKEIIRQTANLTSAYKLQHIQDQDQTKDDKQRSGTKVKGTREASVQSGSPTNANVSHKKLSKPAQKWVDALSSTIDTASHGHASYKDQLASLPWDLEFRFEPILRLSTANIVGHFCRPVAPIKNTPSIKVIAEHHDAWAALPDLPLLSALIDDLHAAPPFSSPEIICIPIHFHTISKSHYREALFNLLGKLSLNETHFLSAELVGMGADIAPSVIADYIRALKPHFRTVLLQADLNGNLLEHFAGLPVHAAGLDVDFPGLNKKQLVQKINKFAERSHSYFQRIYVSGITSPELGKAAIENGYNYVSGTSVGRCRHIKH